MYLWNSQINGDEIFASSLLTSFKDTPIKCLNEKEAHAEVFVIDEFHSIVLLLYVYSKWRTCSWFSWQYTINKAETLERNRACRFLNSFRLSCCYILFFPIFASFEVRFSHVVIIPMYGNQRNIQVSQFKKVKTVIDRTLLSSKNFIFCSNSFKNALVEVCENELRLMQADFELQLLEAPRYTNSHKARCSKRVKLSSCI